MSERRKMQFIDWVMSASFLAIGLFLGLAVGEWLKLDGIARWLTLIYIFIPFGFVFLFIIFMHDLWDRIFFNIKPASSSRYEKAKPLTLLLSLPVGLLVGVIGAEFGLSELLP